MTIPAARLKVVKGGLGIVAAPPNTTHVVIGPCSAGPFYTPLRFNDPTKIPAIYGTGLAVKAAAYPCAQTGAPVVVMRIPSVVVAAFISAVTKTAAGSSAITVTGAPLNGFDVVLTITTGGTVGVAGAFYTLSTDGGVTTGAPVALGVATTLALAGTGLTLNFGAGTLTTNGTATFYTFPASEAILPLTTARAAPGGAPSTSVITCTGSPLDAYEAVFEVLVGGIIGSAGIIGWYSLDGGTTRSASIGLGTATSLNLLDGPTELISTGLQLTFAAGTLDAGDRVTFKSTAPGYQAADVITALTALDESPILWSFVHVVGDTDPSKAGSIGAKFTALENAATYSWVALSARDRGTFEPRAFWEARLASQYALFADDRVCIAAGLERITCPINGRSNRRSVLFATIARLLSSPVQEDPGRKKSGPLTSDVSLHDADNLLVDHDARFSSTLHDARFLTHRTFKDEPGVFVTRGNIMYANADFSRIAQRRVMDIASAVYRVVLEEQLNEGFLVNEAGNPDGALPGSVREEDCRRIDREFTTALEDAIVKTGMASGVQGQVSRTDTPLTNGGTLSSKVAVTGLAYIDSMMGEIAYVNPKLAAMQAQAS